MTTPMTTSSGGDRELQGPKHIIVRFLIDYYTQWGQSMMVSGSDPVLGSWNVKQGLPMKPYHDRGKLFWQAELLVTDQYEAQYNYCLVDDKKDLIKWEAGNRRTLALSKVLPDGATVEIHDSWQVGASPENLYSRSAFSKVIFKEDDHSDSETFTTKKMSLDSFILQDAVLVTFKLNCAVHNKQQTVWLTGDIPELGNLEIESALPLTKQGTFTWQAECVIDKSHFPIRYYYFIKDKRGNISAEPEDDRELSLNPYSKKPSAMIICNDGSFRGSLWRGAGLAIPVFSIRSNDDLGAGEFLDLKLLVDLAVKSGLCVVQLLPVNDTSVHGMWWDSYPYSSLSVFALHPLYLRLQAISANIPSDIKEEIEVAKKELDLKDVDYEAVMKTKLRIAKKMFHLEKDKVLNSTKFRQYFEHNKEWLKTYAAFCFLRDLFGTSDHSQWGLFSDYSIGKLEKLVSPESEHYTAISFVYYVQYHLHLQLSEAADYAKSKGVVLKGDLPIGVDRNSVDTWVFPSLFRMNTSTGAPPDYFDKNGQNWGFPTYNWEEMSKDNYAWWRARLSQMANYFNAYRIDHILGFFRIWELPEHVVTGLMGRFRPSIPLSQEELEEQGIWDFDRLCEPYVRCHILQERFGNRWTEVANKYFYEYQHLCYKFKEEYNTEKKILAETKLKEGSPSWMVQQNERTNKQLFELLHEVVLMRDSEQPRRFYPRYGVDGTSSFKELDEHSKTVLLRLYYDYFYHRQDELWRENALKTLPVLMNSSDMLACGEDLGMIPACVQPVLSELGLLGLRIQRMPHTPGQEFALPADYEYTTVCAPSCHDCSTLRAWWEEDADRRTRFFNKVFGISEAPPDKCTADVAHMVLEQHMQSPSMWTIFPLQDLMALNEAYTDRPAKEETINDPSNPKHYWRFRTHVPVETLLKDDKLITTVKSMVISSGRACPTEDDDTKPPNASNGHVVEALSYDTSSKCSIESKDPTKAKSEQTNQLVC